MRLFYYKTAAPSANFGDELNPWLWPRLLPAFDESRKNVFIGMGTVLNDAIPSWINEAENAIFFSTGVGYGRSFRVVKPQPNWRLYCVRGPLSADRLNLPQSLAITDGAALLKRFFDPIPQANRRYKFSYMPHFRHGSLRLFKDACERTGMQYIDPGGSVADVITAISRSQVLISEAMHGAIVADTLRVPWIPVRTSPRILPFKWRDWCASVKVPYQPHIIQGVRAFSLREGIQSVRSYLQGQSLALDLVSELSMNDFSLGFGSEKMPEAALAALDAQIIAVTRKTPYLSSEPYLESLVVRLEDRLDALRKDIGRGVFS